MVGRVVCGPALRPFLERTEEIEFLIHFRRLARARARFFVGASFADEWGAVAATNSHLIAFDLSCGSPLC